jgi:hypothetical protein
MGMIGESSSPLNASFKTAPFAKIATPQCVLNAADFAPKNVGTHVF